MKSTIEPIRILILEDAEPAITALRTELGRKFAGAQLTIMRTVEETALLKDAKSDRYDIILLDYFCAHGGSFHSAPLKQFDSRKIISISSSDAGNHQAKLKGIKQVVKKDVFHPTQFAQEVARKIDHILPKSKPRRIDSLASPQEADKKARERKLIEQFIARTPEYKNFIFVKYDENPDLIYAADGDQIGFESVIIALQDEAIECYFEPEHCRLRATRPSLHNDSSRLRSALTEHVIDHLRHYKIPTVIVFTIIGADEYNLADLSKELALPQLNSDNIERYFLMNSHSIYEVRQTTNL
ncbi:hypothetical protein KBC99_01055 [Candidatus Saccharibacteria bacterium]|nr:hypothetical protein [Candidatus Saccharibacteria bacterium]